MSKQIQILDSELSQIPLTTIDLQKPYLQAFEQKGFTTIGDLYDLQVEGIAISLNIEFSDAENIWNQVLELVSSPEKWSIQKTFAPIVDLPNDLISVIKSFFAKADKPRLFTILVRRFGLNGNKKYTLRDIGAYFDISHERVRQLEKELSITHISPKGNEWDKLPIHHTELGEVKTCSTIL